jgi:hypothetical protein
MLNETKNERENEMTFQFDDFDTQIQSEELVSDEELYAAEEYMGTLEDELDAVEDELDILDAETRLADAEWDAHWEAMDMDLLDASGELHDYDEDE